MPFSSAHWFNFHRVQKRWIHFQVTFQLKHGCQGDPRALRLISSAKGQNQAILGYVRYFSETKSAANSATPRLSAHSVTQSAEDGQL